MSHATPPRSPAPLFLLWAIVLLELLSPVPALLTLGAAYVLLFRPAWFPRLVDRIYAENAPRAAQNE